MGLTKKYAMMGHKNKLKSWDEWDYLTGWRKLLHHDKGRSHRAKKGYQRRIRRAYRQHLRDKSELDD